MQFRLSFASCTNVSTGSDGADWRKLTIDVPTLADALSIAGLAGLINDWTFLTISDPSARVFESPTVIDYRRAALASVNSPNWLRHNKDRLIKLARAAAFTTGPAQSVSFAVKADYDFKLGRNILSVIVKIQTGTITASVPLLSLHTLTGRRMGHYLTVAAPDAVSYCREQSPRRLPLIDEIITASLEMHAILVKHHGPAVLDAALCEPWLVDRLRRFVKSLTGLSVDWRDPASLAAAAATLATLEDSPELWQRLPLTTQIDNRHLAARYQIDLLQSTPLGLATAVIKTAQAEISSPYNPDGPRLLWVKETPWGDLTLEKTDLRGRPETLTAVAAALGKNEYLIDTDCELRWSPVVRTRLTAEAPVSGTMGWKLAQLDARVEQLLAELPHGFGRITLALAPVPSRTALDDQNRLCPQLPSLLFSAGGIAPFVFNPAEAVQYHGNWSCLDSYLYEQVAANGASLLGREFLADLEALARALAPLLSTFFSDCDTVLSARTVPAQAAAAARESEKLEEAAEKAREQRLTTVREQVKRALQALATLGLKPRPGHYGSCNGGCMLLSTLLPRLTEPLVEKQLALADQSGCDCEFAGLKPA